MVTAVGLERSVEVLEIVSKLPTRNDVDDKVNPAAGSAGTDGDSKICGISVTEDSPTSWAPHPTNTKTKADKTNNLFFIFTPTHNTRPKESNTVLIGTFINSCTANVSQVVKNVKEISFRNC